MFECIFWYKGTGARKVERGCFGRGIGGRRKGGEGAKKPETILCTSVGPSGALLVKVHALEENCRVQRRSFSLTPVSRRAQVLLLLECRN